MSPYLLLSGFCSITCFVEGSPTSLKKKVYKPCKTLYCFSLCSAKSSLLKKPPAPFQGLHLHRSPPSSRTLLLPHCPCSVKQQHSLYLWSVVSVPACDDGVSSPAPPLHSQQTYSFGPTESPHERCGLRGAAQMPVTCGAARPTEHMPGVPDNQVCPQRNHQNKQIQNMYNYI